VDQQILELFLNLGRAVRASRKGDLLLGLYFQYLEECSFQDDLGEKT
jgi:hypothetical protein